MKTIHRGGVSLAVIGCYYGLIPVAVVFLAAAVGDLAAPALGRQIGISALVLACLVMSCHIAKAALCRVIVEVNGNVKIVNLYRKHLVAASDIRGAELKRIAGKQELAVRVRLSDGYQVTCMALGVSEVEDFRVALGPWLMEWDERPAGSADLITCFRSARLDDGYR